MMGHLTQKTQRAAAIDYVKHQLGRGSTLAKILLETIDFQKGDPAILSKAPLDLTEITQFTRGHMPPTRQASSRVTIGETSYVAYPKATAADDLIEFIYSSLENPGEVCLLENHLAQSGDRWLERSRSRIATFQLEVYHMLIHADRARTNIGDAIREAESVPVFLGAIGRQTFDPNCEVSKRCTVTAEQLRIFANTVHCVFVGAYDEEGYVVWQAVTG